MRISVPDQTSEIHSRSRGRNGATRTIQAVVPVPLHLPNADGHGS